jgi:hypothetical protein
VRLRRPPFRRARASTAPAKSWVRCRIDFNENSDRAHPDTALRRAALRRC